MAKRTYDVRKYAQPKHDVQPMKTCDDCKERGTLRTGIAKTTFTLIDNKGDKFVIDNKTLVHIVNDVLRVHYKCSDSWLKVSSISDDGHNTIVNIIGTTYKIGQRYREYSIELLNSTNREIRKQAARKNMSVETLTRLAYEDLDFIVNEYPLHTYNIDKYTHHPECPQFIECILFEMQKLDTDFIDESNRPPETLKETHLHNQHTIVPDPYYSEDFNYLTPKYDHLHKYGMREDPLAHLRKVPTTDPTIHTPAEQVVRVHVSTPAVRVPVSTVAEPVIPKVEPYALYLDMPCDNPDKCTEGRRKKIELVRKYTEDHAVACGHEENLTVPENIINHVDKESHASIHRPPSR
jgi:hypothetical protein